MTMRPLGTVLEHIRRMVGGSPAADSADGELLQRFAVRRDEAAFEALFRRHAPMVLGVCQRVLQDHGAAEDACQATFLILARKAAAVRAERSAAGWLYQVAYRVAVRAKGAAALRRSEERQAVTMTSADGLTEVERRELRAVLDEELQRLPEKYRTPLVLCYLQGKAAREAARELGWPEGSMPKRLARAQDLLRDRLARRGVALAGAWFGLALAEGAAPAAVPPALVGPTVQAAALLAAGKAAAAAEVAVSATALAEGVLKTMWLTQVKIVAALALVLGAAGAGAGVLVYQAQGDKSVPVPKKENGDVAAPKAELSATVALATDPGTVRVEYRNGTDQEVKINRVAIASPILALAVLDAAGKVVPTVPPPLPSPEEIAIPAGKTKSFSYTLNHFSPPLPAGRYGIRVRLPGWVSNQLQYEVKEKEASRRLGAVAVGMYAGEVIWQPEDDGKHYRVDVQIPKPAKDPAIKAERLEVWLLAQGSQAAALKERPQGALVEAGNDKGVTADAIFLFTSALPRDRLVAVAVSVDGKLTTFPVPPARTAAKGTEPIVITKMIYSGREDPRWIPNEEERKTIAAKFGGLPEAKPTDWKEPRNLGYRGFHLVNDGVPDLPDSIHVHEGVLKLTTGKKVEYFKDANGLEKFLLDTFK